MTKTMVATLTSSALAGLVVMMKGQIGEPVFPAQPGRAGDYVDTAAWSLASGRMAASDVDRMFSRGHVGSAFGVWLCSWLLLDVMALFCTYSDEPDALLPPCLRFYHKRQSYVWSWWGLQHPLCDACRIYRLVREFNVSMTLLNEVFRAHCNTITGKRERAWFWQRWCGSRWI